MSDNGIVDVFQQPHQVRRMLNRVGISHGDEAVVTLTKVRMGVPSFEGEAASKTAKVVPFFCDIEPITSASLIAMGDGASIPETHNVRLSHRLRARLPQHATMVNIYNAVIRVNGVVHICVGPYTVVETV